MRNGLMAAILVLAACGAQAQQKPAPPAPGTPGGSLDLKPIGLQPLALNNLSYSPLSLPRLDFGSVRQTAGATPGAAQQTGTGFGTIAVGGTSPFLVQQASPAMAGRTQPFGSNMLTFDITSPGSAPKFTEPLSSYDAYRQKVWDQYNYKPPTQAMSSDPFLTGNRTP